jgi:hypothetical protein
VHSNASQADSQSTPSSSASRNDASTTVSDDINVHVAGEISPEGVPHISETSADGSKYQPIRPLASTTQGNTASSAPTKKKDTVPKKGAKHMLRRLANRIRNF